MRFERRLARPIEFPTPTQSPATFAFVPPLSRRSCRHFRRSRGGLRELEGKVGERTAIDQVRRDIEMAAACNLQERHAPLPRQLGRLPAKLLGFQLADRD